MDLVCAEIGVCSLSSRAVRYHACGRLLVPIWVCAMHSVENVDVRGYPIPSQNGRASCSMATLCPRDREIDGHQGPWLARFELNSNIIRT